MCLQHCHHGVCANVTCRENKEKQGEKVNAAPDRYDGYHSKKIQKANQQLFFNPDFSAEEERT